MNTKEEILKILIARDAIGDGKAEGIAKQAIQRGYASLTPAQEYVLKKHFNPKCEGHPFDSCSSLLSDEEQLTALEEFSEHISCSSCMAQIEHQEHAWARMENE